ncbi:MAG TPA: hypothetical protein VN158_00520, partial [Caulobacter sp.]|nr:hypothetical protein [Caulobacter sp.]
QPGEERYVHRGGDLRAGDFARRLVPPRDHRGQRGESSASTVLAEHGGDQSPDRFILKHHLIFSSPHRPISV